MKPVAIIGMSSIFPQAEDLTQYWDNILGEVECIHLGQQTPSVGQLASRLRRGTECFQEPRSPIAGTGPPDPHDDPAGAARQRCDHQVADAL